MKEITDSAVGILGQLREVVAAIKFEDYKKVSPILNGSTIGQHIRHTLEFFVCLMDANAGDYINYDQRKRDMDIEQDKLFADKIFGSVEDYLKGIKEDKKLTLGVDYGVEKDIPVNIDTNLFREIAYNIEHLVHHMAIIKIGIKDVAPYVEIPEGFGVANSTLKYAASTLVSKSNNN